MSDDNLTTDLLERSRGGDLDAFDDLVRLHQAWVRGYLRARLRDWVVADDLAQDVFITAFRNIRGFRGDAQFEAWLRGIALNLLRNYIRKHREECVGGSEELQTILEQSLNEQSNPHDESDSLAALRECLEGVDGPSRQLLNHRYLGGKSVREIAVESGRGYSALTMQLHRLRQLLGECMEQKLANPQP